MNQNRLLHPGKVPVGTLYLIYHRYRLFRGKKAFLGIICVVIAKVFV